MAKGMGNAFAIGTVIPSAVTMLNPNDKLCARVEAGCAVATVFLTLKIPQAKFPDGGRMWTTFVNGV
jgi:hypothetical protein